MAAAPDRPDTPVRAADRRGDLLIQILCTVVLVAGTLATDHVSASEQKQVLVLYPTRRDAQVAVLGDSRLPRLIEQGLSARVDYYSEHLDIARFPEDAYQAAVADFLRSKYRDQRFDLIVAMHETTLEFAAANRDRLFPGAPIAFFANFGDVERPPNSAGVVATTDFARTVSLATALQPDLEKLFVVTGEDIRDSNYERQVRAQLRPFAPRLAIQFWSGLTTSDLKQRLRTLPERSAVYYVVVNRDGAGQSVHPLLYLDDIAAITNAPIYSWVDSAMGRGILGGGLKSQAMQIEAVAEVALRVLQGEPADSIPLATPDLTVNQVDWRQLRRWRIDRSRVPAGTVVRFEELSIWDRYKAYVAGAVALVLAQTALISGLLLQRRQRRLAEGRARRSQAKLRTSYDRIRALGSRLLHAQETERAHIARELHDDISQQLAILSNDLQRLRSVDLPGVPDLTARSLANVDAVARSVRDLSRRLYPATLRLIGLTAALRGLQLELSRAGLDIDLRCEDVPSSLPPDVTLCVYRVVQEALQNVGKHARARHVSVRLAGSEARLSLTIEDDGDGFDVDAAMGTGLGLISMHERLEALGGGLAIRSAPGSGTRIEVTVPVRAEPGAAAAAV
jgi:signal transduction histidine kinase